MTFRLGPVTVICAEEPEECELCHQTEELRPYGPNGERVCFPCAEKDPIALERGVRKMLGLE